MTSFPSPKGGRINGVPLYVLFSWNLLLQENLSQITPVVKEMQVVLAAVLGRYSTTSIKHCW